MSVQESGKLHEECGVFGVYDKGEAGDVAALTYYGLYALQHRGQESCGMAINDDGVFTLHLTRPLEHEGKTYSDLTFDFDSLSCSDSLAIERELQMLGHTVIVANFDSEYLIRVCVKACTEPLGIDALGKLSIRDFNRLRNTVRGFLSRKE